MTEAPKRKCTFPDSPLKRGFLSGQYLEAQAVLYEQAARLVQLTVNILEPGKPLPGYNATVDNGFKGVVVYVKKPEDLDLYWKTFDELKKAAADV